MRRLSVQPQNQVFGLELFGTYLNVLHTSNGIVPLGVHRGSGGATVETQVKFDAGLPYLGPLAKQPDVEGALMDPAYDCTDQDTRYVTVRRDGVNKVVPESGSTRFAYVVENR